MSRLGHRRNVGEMTALAALAVLAACGSTGPNYVPRDPVLRAAPLSFFVAPPARPARALVFFFGNDIGFWQPHRELAARLARERLDVVGVDVRPLFGVLPADSALRGRSLRDTIVTLVDHARAELHVELAPLVLMGHSSGAELALWLARWAAPARLAGVVAINPRPAGHLAVTLGDLANRVPSGPGAYSTVALARSIAPAVRIALVRSQHDHWPHDSALVAAGGARLARLVVPFADHSLRYVILSGPVVDRAVDWVLAAPTVARR